jgi:adenine-specific DNA-methyltransferase
MLEKIQSALNSFSKGDLTENALNLFQTLGYESERQLPFDDKSFADFETYIKDDSNFSEKNALISEWQYVDLLFQLTESELKEQNLLFDADKTIDQRITSYLFFVIELTEANYSRTKLSQITREVNKVFEIPVMILFKYGKHLTLAVIDRRPNKHDESKDVLRKVTLIKDIRFQNPHAAHRLILEDLSLPEIKSSSKFTINNFLDLHNAWQKVLDTKELNKRFFKELANWYFWAVENVEFPADEEKNAEVRNATNVIRLITRLMFVWFLKEKGLVADKLFDENYLNTILKFEDESAYYKAILQNLFFATLNSEMNTRKFIAESSGWQNSQFFVHNVFRYRKEFIKPDESIKELFEPIPFLNGGLFECLDKQTEVDGKDCRVRVDGFSDNKKNVLSFPDELFFGAEREIDLSGIYDDKKKAKSKVRGLINILDSYKFTIAENTPIEEEIALDPELLGKVFENLLASYNPETKTTARKQTGSFYTPREIVNYMVDESLIAYLKAKLQTETKGFGFIAFGESQETLFGNEARIQQKFEIPLSNNRWHGKDEELETALRELFNYTDDENKFNETETEILIKAIDNCKILDPACGSGAFPMGILHRLVHLLKKLDKDNAKWKQWQKQKAVEETKKAYDIGDGKEREDRLLEINDVFENNASDYGRKLFLIENCIYGVDIQPIAIQIAKLRFFISLIVDEKTNAEKENLGIRPLPNLETKFVAANTLIGLEAQGGLKPEKVNYLEKDLKEVRAKHFSARTRKTKEKYRAKDKEIRLEIADLLKQGGIKADIADQIAKWNPYDQNAKADWFDAEYMFGIEKGFDIVIGNPPYFSVSKLPELRNLKNSYLTFESTGDVYSLFYEKGSELLRNKGFLTYITSNKWLRASYGKSLRKYFSQKTNPLQLIDFGQTMIFESAVVHSNIILIEKSSNQHKTLAVQFEQDLYKNNLSVVDYFNQNKITATHFSEDIWSIVPNSELFIKQKIESVGIPLKEWNIEFNRGILTGLNEAFIIDENKKKELIEADIKNAEIIKPILRGRDVRRYYSNFANLWLINSHNGLKSEKTKRIEVINNFPKVYEHLLKFRKKAEIRFDKGNHWTNLRNCAYLNEIEKPKIVFSEIVSEPQFHLDTQGFYPEATVFFITGEHLKYLVALLNSKPATYFFKKFYAGGELVGKYRYKKAFLENLPIPKATDAQQTEIAEIVDEIIGAKKHDAKADTSKLECKIDALVYQLYGLTDEEIRIVEGKA